MQYFDSHCHLQFPQYDADREDALARMRERSVGAVVVGTDLSTSMSAVELARRYDFLWASVGLHPTEKYIGLPYGELENLARDPKVVAIGECGLDYFRSESGNQIEKFEQQIALAKKLNKALIVHCRNAHDDCFSVLQNAAIEVPIVMHFFTGPAELAQKYLELGCYLSFPGPVTYTDQYDESIRVTPLDKILAETDAPFAAPVPNRGSRNEPAYIEHVVRKIASVKGIDAEEMSSQIVDNARKVFGLQ